MSGTYSSDRVANTRAGEPWLTAECRHLVEEVKSGKGALELAAEFGRTDGAIRARCHMLLPPQRRAERNSKRLAVELLGLQLREDPEYDWEQQLRDQATAAGKLYWSEAMDTALLEGWQQGANWRELAAATGATEREMARRLKLRGLVASLQEVVDRIGYDPDHKVVDADLDPGHLWVLVVSGLREQPPHISLHTRRSGADTTLSDLTTQHLAAGGRAEELDISLVARTTTTT